MESVKLLWESMRPKQWIKNLIIFAPIAFAQRLFDPEMFILAFLAFLSFCLVSSGVYLLNDVVDREADLHHPEKKERPIASGRLPVSHAMFAMVALFGMALGLALGIQPLVAALAAGYLLLNVVYSFFLKKIVIIDAFSIAFGFVFRMLAGAEALRTRDSNITISTWIILCTLLGSLFLGFCKRRQELSLEDSAPEHRPSLSEYGTRFLDQMIAISTASTVMAYALWTMWPETVEKFHTRRLFWTVPFVCYGIFRYLYLVHQKNLGGSPSKVFLSDFPLIVNIILWVLVVIIILYGGLILNFFA